MLRYKQSVFHGLLGILLPVLLLVFLLSHYLVSYFSPIKENILSEVRSQIESIGHAKKIDLVFSFGRPVIELTDLRLKANDQLEGSVQKIVLGFSIWRSLYQRSPQIGKIKLNQGEIHLKHFSPDGLLSGSHQEITLIDPDHLQVRLSDLKIKLSNQPFKMVLDKLWLKSFDTKKIEAKLILNETPIYLRSEMTGALLDYSTWTGFTYLKSDTIDLQPFKTLFSIKLNLPKNMSGQYWLRYSEGQLIDLQSHFHFGSFQTPYGQLDSVSAEGQWNQNTQVSKLKLRHIVLKYGRQIYKQPYLELRLSHKNTLEEIHLNRLNQQLVQLILKQLKLHQSFPKMLQGELKSLTFTRVDQGWQIKANLEKVALSYKGIYLENISGQLFYEPERVWFKLNSQQAAFSNKKQSIIAENLAAVIEGQHASKGWMLKVKHLELKAVGTALFGDLTYDSEAKKINTAFKLKTDKPLTLIQLISEWIPSKKLASWLKEAVLDNLGRIELNGEYQGGSENIHFGENARLTINAALKKINLNYEKDWPIAKQIDGELMVNDQRLSAVIHRATLSEAPLQNVRLLIPDLFANQVNLMIEGQVKTDLSRMVAYVRQSPLAKLLPVVAGLDLAGMGVLNLDLLIPLREEPVKVNGNIVAHDADLTAPQWDLSFHHLDTKLYFDEQGFHAPNIKAVFFDQPVQGQIIRKTGQSIIKLHGAADYNALFDYLKLPFLKSVIQGYFDYQADLALKEKEEDSLTVFLKPMKIKTTLKLPIVADLSPKTINIYFSKSGLTKLALSQLNDRFYCHDQNGVPKCFLKVKDLDADQVGLLFAKLKGNESEKASYSLKIDVDKLIYQKNDYDNVSLEINQAKNTLPAYSFKTDHFSGKLIEKEDQIELNLDELRFPFSSSVTQNNSESFVFLKKPINVRINSILINEFDLGALSLLLVPSMNNLEVKKGLLDHQAFHLNFSGNLSDQKTEISGKLKANSLQPFLRYLEAEGLVRSANTKAAFHLSWPGAPWQFNQNNLFGKVSLEMRDGFIPKLDDSLERKLGIIKLINVLSFSSLVKKLNLDFSDLNRHGIDFNHVRSKLVFDRNTLKVNKLVLDGNVLFLKISGSLNLLAKQLDLIVHVNPYMTSSLPVIATIAGGPVAGAATWFANKMMNTVVQKNAFYLYKITGPWSDPIVKQLVGPEK